MTQSNQKAPYYPKSHLLAASGVAALLSLALLVFPSSEVEAKKTTLNLELEKWFTTHGNQGLWNILGNFPQPRSQPTGYDDNLHACCSALTTA